MSYERSDRLRKEVRHVEEQELFEMRGVGHRLEVFEPLHCFEVQALESLLL